MLFGKHFRPGSGPEQGKVVAMDRFRNGQSLSALRQAEAYWTALRRDGEIPFRSRIDPRGIENLLEFAFILERIAPGIARFRLAGQHLNRLAGMELRGMPLTGLFTSQGRQAIGAATEQMFDSPAIVELRLKRRPAPGRSARQGQLLMLPLRSDLGDVSRALGVLVTEDRQSSGQCRFDVEHIEVRQVADPEAESSAFSDLKAGAKATEAGFAERQRTLVTTGNHLRLVVSRD